MPPGCHQPGALWTEVGRVGLDRPALQLLAGHPEFALSAADAVAAGMATDAAAYDTDSRAHSSRSCSSSRP